MRYLTLAEALIIAEAVTGIEVRTLTNASRIDLLDSALHAPQAGFGDEEFYPSLIEKAAVLAVRIARNHPLPDGNKRLAWQSLRVFLAVNGVDLDAEVDDAVALMLAVAAGKADEDAVIVWLRDRVDESGAGDDKR